jgi:hypothetical protein
LPAGYSPDINRVARNVWSWSWSYRWKVKNVKRRNWTFWILRHSVPARKTCLEQAKQYIASSVIWTPTPSGSDLSHLHTLSVFHTHTHTHTLTHPQEALGWSSIKEGKYFYNVTLYSCVLEKRVWVSEMGRE